MGLGEAWRALRTKASATHPLMVRFGLGQPRWTPRRYDRLAEEAYQNNVIAYRCIRLIAQNAAAVPWLVFERQGGAELLSRSKPIHLEWRWFDTAELVGARLFEGEAIYLWLALPDIREPRAYVLPWSLEMAKEIAQAVEEGGQDRGILMDKPFRGEWGLDDRPTFHPPPREAPQDKDGQGTPEIFRRPP